MGGSEANPLLPDDYHTNHKGILDLIAINALICGVEIVSSCAFTYTPPLLLKAGLSPSIMTVILGIGPALATISVPSLAEWSDKSTLKMGKRRPLILGYSVLFVISLTTVPFSSELASALNGGAPANNTLEKVILAIGVIILVYTVLATFNPCEALLSDIMVTCNEEHQTLGFNIYSACLSFGCILGYMIVSVHWAPYLPSNLQQHQISFLISFFLLIPCIASTLATTEVTSKFDNSEGFQDMPQGTKEPDKKSLPESKKLPAKIGQCCSGLKKVFLMPGNCYKRFMCTSNVIRRLFYVELFGWATLHCHDFFFTDFVGQYVNNGDPQAEKNSAKAILYDQGIRMGSWCLFLQSITSCIYALLIQRHLMNRFGLRVISVGGSLLFFLSMLFTVAFPSIYPLEISTALSGIGMANLTTTPTLLVTMYFQKKEIYMKDLLDKDPGTSSETRGIGEEVAVLDMAFFLSQLLITCILGPIMNFFSSSLNYMIFSMVSSGLSFIYMLRVIFTSHQLDLKI